MDTGQHNLPHMLRAVCVPVAFQTNRVRIAYSGADERCRARGPWVVGYNSLDSVPVRLGGFKIIDDTGIM